MCALVYERLMCVVLPGGRDEAFAPTAGEARGPRAAAAGEQAACSSPAVGSLPPAAPALPPAVTFAVQVLFTSVS